MRLRCFNRTRDRTLDHATNRVVPQMLKFFLIVTIVFLIIGGTLLYLNGDLERLMGIHTTRRPLHIPSFVQVVVLCSFVALSMFYWRRRLKPFLEILFPFSCGHRKWIFTGSNSKSLQTILLSIDSYLPTIEEMNQCKVDAQAFFSDIKTELENEFENAGFECIFAGSIEERFGIPYSSKHRTPSQFNALYSDFDMMFISDEYVASFGNLGNIKIEEHYMLGFARLLALTPEEHLLHSKEFLTNVHKAVLSSKATNVPGSLCCNFHIFPVTASIKGPCVKISVEDTSKTHFEADITVGIKCLEWPILSDWPTREGRSWPSMDNVRRITSLGFHLVAKPLTDNRESLPAWRFSFSLAEVELSKLVPDTARKCYLALKVMMKDHLQPILPALSSYHIKTVFYNTLEKKPITFWVDENIEECFLTLLKELHEALKSGYCRHFWLKGVDLFSTTNRVLRLRLLLAAQKVERIQEDLAPYIYDDGCCCLCCSRLCCATTSNGLASHITEVDDDDIFHLI